MSDHEVRVEGRHEGVSRAPYHMGSGRPLPLNSKRLTGVLLKQLARGLEISTSASGNELRLVIEGKLRDQGHEPQNVQAVLEEADTGFL